MKTLSKTTVVALALIATMGAAQAGMSQKNRNITYYGTIAQQALNVYDNSALCEFKGSTLAKAKELAERAYDVGSTNADFEESYGLIDEAMDFVEHYEASGDLMKLCKPVSDYVTGKARNK